MAKSSSKSSPKSSPKSPDDPTDFGRFERKITEEINKREAPTFVEGNSIPINIEERSFFDVYELDFGRLDGEPPLMIAGNDAQIALQASLLRAIDQMLEFRGLGSFNFWEWAKRFEIGFEGFESPELKKMRGGKNREVWPGVNREDRPLIRELKPSEALGDIDFKLIQFFPNRNDKSEWKLFPGSYREIAQQIAIYWNQKEGGVSGGVTSRLTSDISQLSKHPYISLYFRELPASAGGRGGTQLESEISFRLMDMIEYEGLIPNKSVISIADIKRFKNSIERIFNATPDKPYQIQRGRGSYTYNNWPLGYKLWLLGNSASEAERIFKDILRIQNHTFDEIYMGVGASRNPAKKYPISQPKKKVVGEDKSLPNQRQTGIVTFRWAKLVLPMTKETFILVSRETRTKVDERLK
ncbi:MULTISPECIES: hypothetical protein [unclassified Microcoleus]|uniref:hypothetical protein n=1 Tax=unclassified Microcoleus TaxID=2642155 RepID=UPI001E181645|nr:MULTISPECIES: hypothetical protein [unclassified Microcoleus]MCC3506236.1 hypothetical protein [Microcoleus sp. PH2017_19_SFW_U_A]MCC3523963.1 hypothetical protein [Microcoleus sp. PH2017_20_SFW_D_A]MCC3554973.1 hypothetical protein [Microcoleus sp. PH2017_35_SFW_U_B]MCC3564510.1 hypothetical protein [Microcoleus sp. PH2017_31_RDM_U_A]MCC3577929.1 hypothetical protein [Microcoleus sp. PH2017_32_RDM_D_A]